MKRKSVGMKMKNSQMQEVRIFASLKQCRKKLENLKSRKKKLIKLSRKLACRKAQADSRNSGWSEKQVSKENSHKKLIC
jgi:hypothetical protein